MRLAIALLTVCVCRGKPDLVRERQSMNRPSNRLVALLLTMLATATGCHPTQPFYLHEDGDLSHYLATATEMENPDIEQVSLEEVTQARAPLTLSDLEFTQFRDVTLGGMRHLCVAEQQGDPQSRLSDAVHDRRRPGGSHSRFDYGLRSGHFRNRSAVWCGSGFVRIRCPVHTNVFWEKTDRPQNSVVPRICSTTCSVATSASSMRGSPNVRQPAPRLPCGTRRFTMSTTTRSRGHSRATGTRPWISKPRSRCCAIAARR